MTKRGLSVVLLHLAAGWLLVLSGCTVDADPEPPFWQRSSEWVFEDSTLWSLSADTLILVRPGTQQWDIRRPGAVATVQGTEDLETFHMRARFRSTQDTSVIGRDVIFVFGYQSPTEFYYAHLSNDNTVMPHNGIFVVDNADRRRIDDQGVEGEPEARLTDQRWHQLRLDRESDTGHIRVFMDDMRVPLLTAVDTTFRRGAIGFGSFDDVGIVESLAFAEGPSPILNPVPERPSAPRLEVHLEPFVQIPASDTTGPPAARINFLTHPGDGSDRLFVPDLRGSVYVIEDGSVIPYLDARQYFPDFVDAPGLGSGLGFVAFHPEFESNGLFYTVHTEAGQALESKRPDYRSDGEQVHGVVTEWKTTDPSASSFSGTHRQVMRLGFRAMLHGIQQIGFHPLAEPGDPEYGLLYVAVGDGEAPLAQSDAPQRLDRHNGKIFRIDPTGSDSPNGGYGIPEQNPFADQKGALGEIWALGLRNPHRFSWDEATGRMYIGHIGEAGVDVVFEGVEGGNYGWNEREGGFRYEKEDHRYVYPLAEASDEVGAAVFEQPMVRLDHDEMTALVGGFVYRAGALPALTGHYVFGDLSSGRIFEFNVQDGRSPRVHDIRLVDGAGYKTDMIDLSGVHRAEIRFGQDAAGQLYVLSKANGQIWKATGARHLRALTEGVWEASLAPMNHPDQSTPITFSFRYESDALTMMLAGPGGMEIPIQQPRLDGDTLRFAFNEPEANTLLTCALAGSPETGFYGRCADDTGKWAGVSMKRPGS